MAVNKCIKYCLFFFNLLFWLSGCFILGVSIYLKVTKDEYKLISVELPALDLLVVISVAIMVFGFLGCCGALRESRCMLLLFFLGILLIFVLLLAAGILGAVGKEKVKKRIINNLEKKTLSNWSKDMQSDLHSLEKEANCCGLLEGHSDWGANVPDSCNCSVSVAPEQCVSLADGRKVYRTPCIEFVKQHFVIILGIAFGIAVLMLFGMTFAMTLFCQIGRKDTTTA